MTWAIQSAVAGAEHAGAIARGEGARGDWTRAHRRLLRSRHLVCGAIAAGLRRPMVVNLVRAAIEASPTVASAIAERLCGRRANESPEPA